VTAFDLAEVAFAVTEQFSKSGESQPRGDPPFAEFWAELDAPLHGNVHANPLFPDPTAQTSIVS
jgi:hypothetical protein